MYFFDFVLSFRSLLFNWLLLNRTTTTTAAAHDDNNKCNFVRDTHCWWRWVSSSPFRYMKTNNRNGNIDRKIISDSVPVAPTHTRRKREINCLLESECFVLIRLDPPDLQTLPHTTLICPLEWDTLSVLNYSTEGKVERKVIDFQCIEETMLLLNKSGNLPIWP